MNPGVLPRLRSIQALTPVLNQQASLSTSLPAAQCDLSAEDAALVQALAFGVCRFFVRLQWLSSQLLERPLKPRDQDVQILLLIGLYQLQAGRVADYAILDTCVETSKSLHKPWAAKLLNACLRRYLREADALNAQADQKEATRYSLPAWLLKKLKKAYPKHWTRIAEASNQQAPMTLRVNPRKISREDWLAACEAAGFAAQPTSLSPWGVQLEKPCHPTLLPGYALGHFSVQDESAQLAALLVQPQTGEHLLDACCAPGGKTTHLAELADLKLLALDVDAQRLVRVKENLERLALNAEVIAADAAATTDWWDGTRFDAILLDAPCSATGVIRRHPDIKLLRRESDLDALIASQSQLLDALWPLLKSGGRLVYATCSILPQENQHQLDQFLHRTPDAQAQPIAADWGLTTRSGQQLLPNPDGGDGFFYARINKL